MKLGDKVWFLAGSKNAGFNKELMLGEYIANINNKYVIRSGKKIYRRPISVIAKYTGKEKLDFS